MTNATVCFAGFPREEAAAVENLFEQANALLEHRWRIADETQAQVLIIDMDSMYGHMTWLKAQGSGKTTVGLTTGSRAETDLLLNRPLKADALAALLGRISGQTPSANPQPAPVKEAIEPVAPEPARTTGQQAALPASAARISGQAPAMPAAPPRERRVWDYLVPGALDGPVKLQLADAPALALDPATQTYAGSATLKALLPYVEAVLNPSDLTGIAPAEFEALKTQHGGAHPYARLLWLCGLSTGNGQLLPGFDPNLKYHLAKWPQIEREFPKHFRVATVMMKGPARLAEIAEQSTGGLAEVTDFVNANLLTGMAVAEGSTLAELDLARACALLAGADNA